MRRFLLALSALLIILNSDAQIPAGYYDSATGKTCAALKTALFNIISTNTTAITNANVLVAFSSTDVHRNDANTADIIWDIYSDNPAGPEAFTYTSQVDNCGGTISGEGDCYNREHTFPQAWFNSTGQPLTDLFALYPTDGESNAQHGNYPYSEVANPVYTSSNGSMLGTNTVTGFPTAGVAARAFEVRDDYKGDIARNYFYMVTRYESDMPAWQSNANANDVLNGTTWPSFDDWYIKLLYKWHLQDPVSQKEIDRNNAVSTFQQNRNPFIDHPEYVALIWQCTGLLPVVITDFTAVKSGNDVLLQWNVNRELNFRQYEVERSVDGIHFNTIAIVSASNREHYILTDNNLPGTKKIFYRLKLIDIDGQSSYSRTISLKLDVNPGGFTIYPNPAINELTLHANQLLQPKSVVKVTDIAGKEVYRYTMQIPQNNIRIKVDHLPAGRYFVTVISDNNLQHDSFVILQ